MRVSLVALLASSALASAVATGHGHEERKGISLQDSDGADGDSPSNVCNVLFLQTAHLFQREAKYHWPSRGRFPFFAVSENNVPFHVNDTLAWHLGREVDNIGLMTLLVRYWSNGFTPLFGQLSRHKAENVGISQFDL